MAAMSEVVSGEAELVLLSVADRVATVTLNRPHKLNATTMPMMALLVRTFADIKARPDVSVVILKGAGRAFCAGHDMGEELVKPPHAVVDEILREQRWVHDSYKELREMLWEIPQPVIAQVHGYAFTIGVELAMYCDLVYASTDLKIGWRPVGGSGRYMHMWPWLIGIRRTKEMLYTGRMISGAEAAEIGMVNAALPPDELEAHVLSVARQIAQVPLSFLSIEKQTTNKCFDLMGAREGQEFAATMHAIAHHTEAGLRMVETVYAKDASSAKQRAAARDEKFGVKPGE
jgi:enoyl-CoA hydratase